MMVISFSVSSSVSSPALLERGRSAFFRFFRVIPHGLFSHFHGTCSFISIDKSIIIGINKFKCFLIKIVAKEPILNQDAFVIIYFFQAQHVIPIIITGATNESDLGFDTGIVRKVEFS